jgi:hypothetical protein
MAIKRDVTKAAEHRGAVAGLQSVGVGVSPSYTTMRKAFAPRRTVTRLREVQDLLVAASPEPRALASARSPFEVVGDCLRLALDGFRQETGIEVSPSDSSPGLLVHPASR